MGAERMAQPLFHFNPIGNFILPGLGARVFSLRVHIENGGCRIGVDA
jgi:hypothetical protein